MNTNKKFGPGSIKIEVSERMLPNGEVVKWVYKKEVFLDETGRHCIIEKSKIPQLMCSCQPMGMSDIRQCANCEENFCRAHTINASCCGIVLCLRCASRQKIKGKYYCKKCWQNREINEYQIFYFNILFSQFR